MPPLGKNANSKKFYWVWLRKKNHHFWENNGGSVIDDAPEPVSVSHAEEEEVEAEELSGRRGRRSGQGVIIEEVEEEVSVAPRQPQATTKEGNEDWLNDFEGQLKIDMYQTKDNVIIKSTIAEFGRKTLILP